MCPLYGGLTVSNFTTQINDTKSVWPKFATSPKNGITLVYIHMFMIFLFKRILLYSKNAFDECIMLYTNTLKNEHFEVMIEAD